MICINCHNKKTSIINSRSIKKGLITWRRHECPKCGYAFTTHESIPLEGNLLVSQNDKTAPYRRGHLLKALINSLTAVGDSSDAGFALLENIEQKLIGSTLIGGRSNVKPSISSTRLAQITYETLVAYNTAAGTAYGAAHGLVITGSQKKRRGRPMGS